MNITNMQNLKQYYSVVNRREITPEIYDFLIKRWEMDDINLEEEAKKIENKKSELPRSRRNAVKEFLILKNLLKLKEQQAEEEINFNDN